MESQTTHSIKYKILCFESIWVESNNFQKAEAHYNKTFIIKLFAFSRLF